MKYILILSLILTMGGGLVGSAIDTITLSPNATDSATAEKVFLFKLKVNNNMVLLNNARVAVFDVWFDFHPSTDQILELVKASLISAFGLNVRNIEDVSFSFMTAHEPNIEKHLRAPNMTAHEPNIEKHLRAPKETVSMVCISTCELATKDYPAKERVNKKYLNWSAFFLTETSEGKFALHQKDFNETK